MVAADGNQPPSGIRTCYSRRGYLSLTITTTSPLSLQYRPFSDPEIENTGMTLPAKPDVYPYVASHDMVFLAPWNNDIHKECDIQLVLSRKTVAVEYKHFVSQPTSPQYVTLAKSEALQTLLLVMNTATVGVAVSRNATRPSNFG